MQAQEQHTTMQKRHGLDARRAGTSTGRVRAGLMAFARGCCCVALGRLHLLSLLFLVHPASEGKTRDSNSTRGQRTKISSVCMHKVIQAHNTPHTIVQQSAGGTHTASTGTGIEVAGLIGYAREPRTRNCETICLQHAYSHPALPVFPRPSTRTALRPPAPPAFCDHASTRLTFVA